MTPNRAGRPLARGQAGPVFPAFFKYDAKILRGRNGRLFLDNDSNRVLDQMTGKLRFTPEQLAGWQRLLERRIAALADLGIPYFFVVPPTAYAVYPEDLPDEVRIVPHRPVHQLMEHLDEAGSQARLIYPLDELLAAKPDPLLYAKTDTHWSARGAFVCYRALVRAIGSRIALHAVSADDLELDEWPWTGDLGFKLEPQEESVLVTARIPRPQATLLSDNRVYNRGMTLVTDCREAPPTCGLLFGDSFSLASLPFFAASFGRFVFAYSPTMDLELVRRTSPDVVIGMLNERFLLTVPDDAAGPTIEQLEQEKKEAGMVRDMPLPYWPLAAAEAS